MKLLRGNSCESCWHVIEMSTLSEKPIVQWAPRPCIWTFAQTSSSWTCTCPMEERNPVAKSARPKVPPGEIGILSVDEATRLLASSDPKILGAIAIRLFAGLRRAEIERLDWSDIDPERGYIEVKAAKVKTAMRRLVTIEPNLAAWLSPLVCKSGPVCPPDKPYRRFSRKAITAAGIEDWPFNALRHSFASYHLAHYQDAAKTAPAWTHRKRNSSSALSRVGES
jgi:integrase